MTRCGSPSLGVGLIGGSIGLAARQRLGAEVAGFDPDPATLERGLELGALDRAGASLEDAVEGATAVFCAAPVGALPELVALALGASARDAVVTDVGSTKVELIASLPDDASAERFIGGHPLAGAETSGVANARADLLEGARWFLVPTERSSGLLYDRLQRLVADLGARPQAIKAEVHDRMMAAVSHAPHVLANVLVQQAAATLEESDRLPEVGPSFRDTARVAGANPAIWDGIFASNREAVAEQAEALAARLAEVAELIRSGDGEAVGDWHRRARAERRRLLDPEVVGGELWEVRLGSRTARARWPRSRSRSAARA